MAASLKRQKPIGSSEWVAAEKENVRTLVSQETEEVEFPARHEMEWLNEHMAEIFRGNSLNVTELFKTPGKMRGKTPRTIRKHQTPRTARTPLTEIFSAARNPARNRSPLPRSQFNQKIAKLASNKESSLSPLSQNQNSNPNYNTDSGYHGMPDDDDMQMIPSQQPEKDTQADTQQDDTQPDDTQPDDTQPDDTQPDDTQPDDTQPDDTQPEIQQEEQQPEPTPHKEPTPVREPTQNTPARRTQSFHSAEASASKEPTTEPMELDFEYSFPPRPQQNTQPEYPSLPTERQSLSKNDTLEPTAHAQDDLDEHLDIGSPSEHSTPDRPLIRKSSLNFASLPAREPLNTKRSMGGGRNSYIDRGFPGRQTNGARLTQAMTEKSDLADKMEIDERPSGETKSHGKTSTQLLHEKINMLGKTQAPRTTKSISANAQSIAYPDLPASKPEPAEERLKAREQTPASELRARPSTSQQLQTARKNVASPRPQTSHAERRSPGTIPQDARSPARGMFNPSRFWHGKSNSTSLLASPPKNAEAGNIDTTTPVNSPRRYEGPLSASKDRLQSIMKSAKGLFSSSASASATARQESQSPSARRVETKAEPTRVQPQSPVKYEGRRTRSSTEREQRRREEQAREKEREEREEREHKERQEREERERVEREARELIEKEERELKEREEQAKAREQEKQKVQSKNAPVMQKLDRVQIPVPKMNQSSPRKMQPPSKPAEEESKLALPKPKGRPVKPTRDTTKPKPQPVSIRVGTHSQRMAMSQQQPVPEPPATKLKSTAGNNTSSTSLHTTASSSSFKSNSSTASAKSKSTVAKKKELEAQKRQDARREAERKKAAQDEARRQDELRRQEQAEAERRDRERFAAQEDPKKAAQRQAIEKRRLENARKLEQQRAQQATPSHSRASTLQDRPGFGSSQRGDRPPSRLQSSQRPINVPLPNPAKPPKRAIDEESSRIGSIKPGVVQQSDGKRRKTDEEIEQPMRPTMAPPIRQSAVRKDTMKQGYGNGYSTMPAQGSSMFRNPSLGPRQFQAPPGQPRAGHPLDISKYASGKIPFAEPSNAAPAPATVPPPHYSVHKTPAHAQRPPKSSPAYPNGDAIKLPEIPTDSEDSDSDAEPYNVPDWAREENLGQLLVDQEGRDAESVFGPSAPLHMEEIFKDNKERFKRFRDRTSSANWLSTGDGLTADEVKWDLEQRERLKKNGGWTYNPATPAREREGR